MIANIGFHDGNVLRSQRERAVPALPAESAAPLALTDERAGRAFEVLGQIGNRDRVWQLGQHVDVVGDATYDNMGAAHGAGLFGDGRPEPSAHRLVDDGLAVPGCPDDVYEQSDITVHCGVPARASGLLDGEPSVFNAGITLVESITL